MTPTNTDSESLTTPTKATAHPRGWSELAGAHRQKVDVHSPPSMVAEDMLDAEEVASMIESDGASPPPVGISSDDFGGYD